MKKSIISILFVMIIPIGAQKILIIGSGAREHTLAWKCAQSPQTTKIFVAPGNAGIAQENKTENVAIDPNDFNSLITFAKENSINLTIVGSEEPLSSGIVDAFRAEGLSIVGPTQKAAQIEASKVFAKQCMQRHGIPTAPFAVFTDAQQAKEYVALQSLPIVIKADGLAAGKGVTIAYTIQEAYQAIDDILVQKKFSTSQAIVIEQFLTGKELSFFVITDGEHVQILPASIDYKKLSAAQDSPMTGGIGAVSFDISPKFSEKIMHTIIYPILNGLQSEGIEYTGFLYAGLMITEQGDPYVLEFNCRLGDPETQAILMRLQTDFVSLCEHIVNKTVHTITPQWSSQPAMTIVLTTQGYPFSTRKGDPIIGIENINSSCKIFHAGTAIKNNQLITNGGRILSVTCTAPTLETARSTIYAAISKIQWPGMYYRSDIGMNVKESIGYEI